MCVRDEAELYSMYSICSAAAAAGGVAAETTQAGAFLIREKRDGDKKALILAER